MVTDSLSIDQLVEYVNLELNKDKKISVNKLCDKIGIKKSTLKSKMGRANYSYNAEKRIYEKNGDVTSNITQAAVENMDITCNITERESSKEMQLTMENMDITSNITEAIETKEVQVIAKNTDITCNITDINAEKLNLLLDNLDSILKLVSVGNITSNIDNASTLRSGDNRPSTLRIDSGLYNLVKNRAVRDNINIADIINKSIEDYLQNYL